jgi:hypothetical protein
MSNTTFSGPVRSEGGFDLIRKNDQGEVTSDLALKYFEESITVAAAATEGTGTVAIPSNFVCMSVVVTVTEASTNAVNLNDVGTTTPADKDGFLDGVTCAANSTGFKGMFVSNGSAGMVTLGGGTTAAVAAPATLTITLSGVPGAGTGSSGLTTFKIKVFGFGSTSDTE